MGISYIASANRLKISSLKSLAALYLLLGLSVSVIGQTPLNNQSLELGNATTEDTKQLQEREQKEIELLSKGEGDIFNAKGYNLALLKNNGFASLSEIVNPRLASTLRKPGLIKLLSASPIIVDEQLNPIMGATGAQSIYIERAKDIRKVESYFDLMGAYIYIPVLRGTIWDVRTEQIIESRASASASDAYLEIDPSYESWVNLQIELGNYCIMDAKGIPALSNIPKLGKEEVTDKLIAEMQIKAYASLFRRWYFFNTIKAKSILPGLIPDWDKIANAEDLYKAVLNLQTTKQTKK